MQGSSNPKLGGVIGAQGMMLSRRRWCVGEVSTYKPLRTSEPETSSWRFQCSNVFSQTPDSWNSQLQKRAGFLYPHVETSSNIC